MNAPIERHDFLDGRGPTVTFGGIYPERLYNAGVDRVAEGYWPQMTKRELAAPVQRLVRLTQAK